MVVEEAALAVAGFALNERKGNVAAEDQSAGAADAVGKARRHRADAGNRKYAERDAGDEDAKAAQPAAQFTPCETHYECSAVDRNLGATHFAYRPARSFRLV